MRSGAGNPAGPCSATAPAQWSRRQGSLWGGPGAGAAGRAKRAAALCGGVLRVHGL